MINAVLTGIIKLICILVDVLLAPIDLIIKTSLPDLSSALSSIAQYFQTAMSSIGFVVSMTGLSTTAISILVVYYTFKLTVPLMVSTTKLAIKWYDKIKP